jgi:hypothetical protein
VFQLGIKEQDKIMERIKERMKGLKDENVKEIISR